MIYDMTMMIMMIIITFCALDILILEFLTCKWQLVWSMLIKLLLLFVLFIVIIIIIVIIITIIVKQDFPRLNSYRCLIYCLYFILFFLDS